MKQIENTLQGLKCMLIEDGYTEANIVLRTLTKAQEQVKNCSIPDVSKCACPPLVACEICGEEKNLDGDFWKNKKKHDC